MKKIIIIISFISSLLSVKAQDDTFVPLEKLLEQVETNYPSIIQYQYNIQAINAKAEGAKAWMPPTFSAGVMRFPYDFSRLSEKNNPMNQAGIGLTIEQMIPNSSKLNAKKNYITSLAEIEKSKRDWTKNELKREAKILYYNRYINEKKKNVLKQNEEILKLLISTSEEKYSNNQAQLQTIYKAKANLAELDNMILMLEEMISESNIGLNILMVKETNSEFLIDTLLLPKKYHLTGYEVSDVSNRSDITAINKYIESLKLEQHVSKIGVRPDFGVSAQHMQMLGMPNQWSIMGMMTIPILPWASKHFSSETKAIDFKIQSMEQEKQTMELMATRMLSEKLSNLRYESAQLESYTKNIIPAYENNLQTNLLAYKQNTGNFFILLDAWQMLLMKQIESFDKLFKILKLEAEYEYEKEIK